MYIDSANVSEITELSKLGFFKGVTTNPTLLLQEKKQRLPQIQRILNLQVGKLFVQLEGATADALYNDFRLLDAEFSKQLIYKIPINWAGLLAIKKIQNSQPAVELLGTAIYSAEQLYLAVLAGCQFVALYVNRMLVQGIDAYEVVASAKKFLSTQGKECQLMGASFTNSQQVKAVYDAGIKTVTLPQAVIYQMLNKDLANQAIAVFNQHAEQLKERE